MGGVQQDETWSRGHGDGREDRHPITEATIKENKLSLRIVEGTRTLAFELTIDGDQITGTGSRAGTSDSGAHAFAAKIVSSRMHPP
jgi:hypothetical protein